MSGTIETTNIQTENIKHTNGTTAATVGSSGELTVSGAFTSQGIDDNANATAITIDSSENVGIGTTSPSHILHTSGTGQTAKFESSNNAYQVELNYSNNTSRAFIGSFSNGIVFAPSSATEAMRINSNDNLLVGTTDDRGRITVHRNTNGAANPTVYFSNDGGSGVFASFGNTSGTVIGTITRSGSSTAYNTSSDHRLKENVTADWDATTRLKQLNPVRFNFIADTDTTVDGFLAHEVQSVVPEAITGTHDEVDDDGNPVYQGIDQSKLVPLLVKTIQELEARITALENAE